MTKNKYDKTELMKLLVLKGNFWIHLINSRITLFYERESNLIQIRMSFDIKLRLAYPVLIINQETPE